MNRQYLYLFSFLVLILPALGFIFYKGHKKLNKHWHVPIYIGFVGLVFAASEGVAFNWQLWKYNPDYTLPARIFNVQAETYVLNFLLFAFIACCTVILMSRKRKSRK